MHENVLSQVRRETRLDDCHGAHTYGGGCYYNADDPKRPVFPAELRPGARLTQRAA